MTIHHVGDYLQSRRKAVGMTQEDVARILGVSSKAVSDWETGTYPPGSDLMARFIDLVKADPAKVQKLWFVDDPSGPPDPIAQIVRDLPSDISPTAAAKIIKQILLTISAEDRHDLIQWLRVRFFEWRDARKASRVSH